MFCSVCERGIDRFLPYGVPPRPGRCPHCGAKPRTRALKHFLSTVVRPRLAPGGEVLEIGPSRVNARMVPSSTLIGTARYTAIDVRALGFHADVAPPHRVLHMDATAMAFADASFDVVLCINTLPYVRDDAGALAEIRRCLRADGIALVETHRGRGRTRSAAEHRRAHPALGDDWFAENGDAWVYGADLLERGAAAGLRPRLVHPLAGADVAFVRRGGLSPDTEWLVAFRTRTGERRFAVP